MRESGYFDADASAQRIADIATAYAQAGCDIVAPSDMMDGRILHIKKTIEAAGLDNQVLLQSILYRWLQSRYS